MHMRSCSCKKSLIFYYVLLNLLLVGVFLSVCEVSGKQPERLASDVDGGGQQ